MKIQISKYQVTIVSSALVCYSCFIDFPQKCLIKKGEMQSAGVGNHTRGPTTIIDR